MNDRTLPGFIGCVDVLYENRKQGLTDGNGGVDLHTSDGHPLREATAKDRQSPPGRKGFCSAAAVQWLMPTLIDIGTSLAREQAWIAPSLSQCELLRAQFGKALTLP